LDVGAEKERLFSYCMFSGGVATLPYTGNALFRLALRSPVDPIRSPELTFMLLEPLGVISRLQE